jgi:hypothetical protein
MQLEQPITETRQAGRIPTPEERRGRGYKTLIEASCQAIGQASKTRKGPIGTPSGELYS